MIRIDLGNQFSEEVTVTVRNIMGDALKTAVHKSNEDIRLNVSELPAGSYFVTVRGKNHHWTGRFIKNQ